MWKCVFPKCGNISSYTFYGRDLCENHWTFLCLADKKKENQFLQKIGLIRDKNGLVIEEHQE